MAEPRVVERNLLKMGYSPVGGECIVLWSALKGFFTRQRDEGKSTNDDNYPCKDHQLPPMIWFGPARVSSVFVLSKCFSFLAT